MKNFSIKIDLLFFGEKYNQTYVMKQLLQFNLVLILALLFGFSLNAQDTQLAPMERAVKLMTLPSVKSPTQKEVMDSKNPLETLLKSTETFNNATIGSRKSAQHLLQLDSIVSSYFSEKYTYDWQGRVHTINVFESWDDDLPMEHSLFITFDYQADTLTEVIIMEVSPDTGETEPSAKQHLVYNADGEMIELIFSLWGGGAWQPFFKLTNEYVNGLSIMESIFIWSDMEGWEPIQNSINFYNDSDQLIVKEIYNLGGVDEGLTLSTIETLTYDDDGFLVEMMVEEWSPWEEEMVSLYKMIYVYDLEIIELTSTTYMNYSSDEEPDWMPFYRSVALKDAFEDGNDLSESFQYWNEDAEEWETDNGTNYFYDMNYTQDEIAAPYFISANKRLSEEYFFVLDGEVEVDEVLTYFYSDFVLSTTATTNPEHTFYPFPNPSGDVVSFSGMENFGTVQLYSIQGALLKHEQLGPGQQMSISDLAPGIYVYTLQHGGERHQGKLIKK